MHDALETAENIARRSMGKMVALIATRTRDVAAAQDALSEAFVAALSDWPLHGCPSNPEAWLLAVARRKAIDAARRCRASERLTAELQILADLPGDTATLPDHRLSLMFACTHPALDPAIRAPLMLQTVLGLDAKVIASAFLTSPSAMGKRLVRAKEKIRVAGIPFHIPQRDELSTRLSAVLNAVYVAFSEGWSDAAGTDPARRELTSEALFLGRLVVEELPGEPEAIGLLALMLHAEARRGARIGGDGQYVPLAEQDLGKWDWNMIREAEALIRRAAACRVVGRFQIEAALQSAHVYRCRTGQSNWDEVVQLYDSLLAIVHSPVVALNRAVAVGETEGPAAALLILDALSEDRRLANYQPYWAARADLLAKVGSLDDARMAFDKAIDLERDMAIRRFLQLRRSLVVK